MWMDGILTEKGKKSKRRTSARRGRSTRKTFTVSARTREIRAERRRRVTTVTLVLIVLAGFGFFGVLGAQALFRNLFSENDKYVIRNWDIQSDGPVLTSSHIRQYARLGDYENLFAIDLRHVLRELERTPAIASAKVERRLPDTLVIRVRERMALARLQLDQPVPLAVATDGFVLGPSSLRPNLPVIRGIRDPGVRPGSTLSDPLFVDALLLLNLANQAHVHPYVRIRDIDISHDEFIQLQLAGGEEVLIARAHIEPRILELVSILQDQRRRGQVAARVNMTGHAHIPPAVTY